ncbi:MAG: hypothetical protein FVQ80_14070 [Planctomycetes bacterium]|nr:hypothetical protein [Planctomycetota bacterium]
MKIETILKKLKSAGFKISFDEQDILLDNPTGNAVLDNQLKEAVKANRQEILFRLRTCEYRHLRAEANKLAEWIDNSDAPIQERRERVPEFKKLVNQIAELQGFVDAYQKNGTAQWYEKGWLLLHSDLLGEMIVVVRDADVQLPEGSRGYPVYEFKEVEALTGASEEQIRETHKIKRVFQGKIENQKMGGLKNAREA